MTDVIQPTKVVRSGEYTYDWYEIGSGTDALVMKLLDAKRAFDDVVDLQTSAYEEVVVRVEAECDCDYPDSFGSSIRLWVVGKRPIHELERELYELRLEQLKRQRVYNGMMPSKLDLQDLPDELARQVRRVYSRKRSEYLQQFEADDKRIDELTQMGWRVDI